MIAAILRAQVLSMRLGASRGALFSILTGMLWYGLWTGAAVAACMLAIQATPSQLHSYLPLVFMGICGYWQIVPVLSASMGSGLDMRKLLLYPVPHGKLFLVEVLLRLTTGAEMVMVLAGGSVGLFFNPAGGWRAVPRLAAAIPTFVVFNLLLASGMRSLLERLLTRRKVRELLSFGLLMLYVVPRVMVQTGTHPKSLDGVSAVAQAMGFPWSAAARTGMPVGPGQFEWMAFLSLCGWTLAALWFGRAQFERNLRYDAVAAQATPLRAGASRWQGWKDRLYRMPGMVWRDPLATIIEKELRSLARTPRFRMVFIMGFTFGVMVWFPMITGRRAGHTPFGSHYFLIVVCIYALTLMGQVTYWNCFGFDRSAAVFYFAAPQPLRKTLVGKNIASLFFIYLEVLVLTSVTAALQVTGGWRTVIETLVVVGVCALYLLALGNISSVHYPRGLRPERVSQGGASSRFQGLIFVLYPLALLPVFMAYLARYAFASEAAFAVGMALAAILGGVLYAMATESAAATAVSRREQILQELSKGDGPMVSE